MSRKESEQNSIFQAWDGTCLVVKSMLQHQILAMVAMVAISANKPIFAQIVNTGPFTHVILPIVQ